MAEMPERAENINDFLHQYLVTLAMSAEFSLTAPPRYGTTTLMRAFKLALEIPLKSREIEDKEVYKRLRSGIIQAGRVVRMNLPSLQSYCPERTLGDRERLAYLSNLLS